VRLLICSDIHGDATALKLALAALDRSQADYLILLGDLLNHGPRNKLPADYDPLQVADRLNDHSEQIIAVRGNCDSEVDQALLRFPMLGEYNQLLIADRRAFFCHGHSFTAETLPPLAAGDIFVSGHTHVPVAALRDSIYLFNPGSVSIPKQNWPASYGIIDEQGLHVHDLNSHLVLAECLFGES
jgi:putative phosphoesterase